MTVHLLFRQHPPCEMDLFFYHEATGETFGILLKVLKTLR